MKRNFDNLNQDSEGYNCFNFVNTFANDEPEPLTQEECETEIEGQEELENFEEDEVDTTFSYLWNRQKRGCH